MTYRLPSDLLVRLDNLAAHMNLPRNEVLDRALKALGAELAKEREEYDANKRAVERNVGYALENARKLPANDPLRRSVEFLLGRLCEPAVATLNRDGMTAYQWDGVSCGTTPSAAPGGES